MSTARKQAPRLARPAARYWKGKAPKGAAEIESDSDADEQEENEDNDVLIEGEQDIVKEEDEDGIVLHKAMEKSKAMNVSLKDVSVSKEGKVIIAGREESGRTLLEDIG